MAQNCYNFLEKHFKTQGIQKTTLKVLRELLHMITDH